MGSIRLYSGDDGQSHIEEIDPPSDPVWSQSQNAKGDHIPRLAPWVFQRLARGTPPGSTSSPSPGKLKSGLCRRYRSSVGTRRRQPRRRPHRPRSHHSRGERRSAGDCHHSPGRLERNSDGIFICGVLSICLGTPPLLCVRIRVKHGPVCDAVRLPLMVGHHPRARHYGSTSQCHGVGVQFFSRAHPNSVDTTAQRRPRAYRTAAKLRSVFPHGSPDAQAAPPA